MHLITRACFTLYSLIFLWILSTLLPAVLMAASSPGKINNHIIVGGDYYYPPYEFLDENGQPTGFNVELTKAIAEIMGFTVEIELGIWGDMVQALDDGKIHALQGMISSKDRTSSFDFSPPHSFIYQSVFARKDSQTIESIDKLIGKSVIVQQNGYMYDYLIKNNYSINLILTQTHAEALTLLASGKHDYAVVANLPGLYLGHELKLSNIVRVAEPVAAAPYGYAVKNGNKEVLALFSQGLALLKSTGKYDEIKNKWLSPLDPPLIPWANIVKYGSMVLFPLLLILIGTVVWNRTLQRQVAIATIDLKKEIAERKRAMEETKLHQQQLIQADKMATLGILVSGVAHEINNPTGLILLNTPLLTKIYKIATENLEARYEEEGDFLIGGMKYSMVRDEIPRMLGEMHDSASRIKTIVRDLKDFARIENSEPTEMIDMNSAVAASLRLVDSTIKKATSDLTVTYGEHLPLVDGNKQRIEQVLVNLIVNACQSLTDTNKQIQITTFFDQHHHEVGVEIIDQGKGVSPNDLNHIFDPFFTTKRSEGGTGLGLAVSHGIVKDHNGRLDYQSTLGKGTCVRMILPSAEKEINNE